MADADGDMWQLVAQAHDCLRIMLRDWDTSTIQEKRDLIDSVKDRVLPVSEQLLVIAWMPPDSSRATDNAPASRTTPSVCSRHEHHRPHGAH